MKENISNFPQKVYIPRDPEYPQFPNIWWEKEPSDSDVEYTRTDVSVERAVQFIKERLNFADNAWYIEGEVTIKDKVIEDFKNYMKGE